MSSSRQSRPRTSSIPDRKTALRIMLYVFIILLMSNLVALVDAMVHPEIPYFDEEHLIVGGVTGVTTILLLGALEIYIVSRKQLEARLNESNEQLQMAETKISKTLLLLDSIVSANPDVIFSTDLNANLIFWNRTVEVFKGLAPGALKNKPVLELFDEEDRPFVLRSIKKCLEEGAAEVEARLFNAQGNSTLFHFKGVLFKAEDGSTVGITGTGRDITERKRAEEEKRESEARYRIIFEGAIEGILIADVETKRLLHANPAFCRMLGYSNEEIIAMSVENIHPAESLEYVVGEIQALSSGEKVVALKVPCLRKNGTILFADIASSAAKIDGKLCNIGFFKDVTERKLLEEKLHTLSIVDELTGLYNRRGFVTLAEQQLKIAERAKKNIVLLFIDIDLMKWINDTLGHQEGDKALLETTEILRQTFRISDIIGRMGGDEFAVLAINTAQEGEKIVARFREALDRHNKPETRKYKLSLSVGVAQFDPENPVSLNQLIASADNLMYVDKRTKPHLRQVSGVMLQHRGDVDALEISAPLQEEVEQIPPSGPERAKSVHENGSSA